MIFLSNIARPFTPLRIQNFSTMSEWRTRIDVGFITRWSQVRIRPREAFLAFISRTIIIIIVVRESWLSCSAFSTRHTQPARHRKPRLNIAVVKKSAPTSVGCNRTHCACSAPSKEPLPTATSSLNLGGVCIHTSSERSVKLAPPHYHRGGCRKLISPHLHRTNDKTKE